MDTEISNDKIKDIVNNYFYNYNNGKEINGARLKKLKYIGETIEFKLYHLDMCAYNNHTIEKRKLEEHNITTNVNELGSKRIYNIFSNSLQKLYKIEDEMKDKFSITHGFDATKDKFSMFYTNNLINYNIFKGKNETEKINTISNMIIRITDLLDTKTVNYVSYYLESVIIPIIDAMNELYKQAYKINYNATKTLSNDWQQGVIEPNDKFNFILNLDIK